jgi:hypothetical protein
MVLALTTESPGQMITRLEREVAHVTDQCRTAHAMAMDWRQRCLDAEARCQRLEQKYRNLRRRKGLEHVAEPDDATESADETQSLPSM